MASLKELIKSRAGLISLIIAILVLWEILPKIGLVSRLFLPPLEVVAKSMTSISVINNLSPTIYTALSGFIFGAVLGIGGGFLFVLVPRLEKAFAGFLYALNTVPKAVLAPLFVVWFGFGYTPKIVCVILVTFFPILINTIDGLRTIDKNLLDLAKSYRATKFHTLSKVRLPNSLQYIFTGLKISAPYAILTAMLAEFLLGYQGLGYMIQLGIVLADYSIVLGMVFWAAILGITVYGVVIILERLVPSKYKIKVK